MVAWAAALDEFFALMAVLAMNYLDHCFLSGRDGLRQYGD